MQSNSFYQYYAPSSTITPRESVLRQCPHCAHCRVNALSSGRRSAFYYSGSTRAMDQAGACHLHQPGASSFLDGRRLSIGGDWYDWQNNRSSSMMFLNQNFGAEDRSSSSMCLNNEGFHGDSRPISALSAERAYSWQRGGKDGNWSTDSSAPSTPFPVRRSSNDAEVGFRTSLVTRLETGTGRRPYDLSVPAYSPLGVIDTSSGYSSPASVIGLSPRATRDSTSIQRRYLSPNPARYSAGGSEREQAGSRSEVSEEETDITVTDDEAEMTIADDLNAPKSNYVLTKSNVERFQQFCENTGLPGSYHNHNPGLTKSTDRLASRNLHTPIADARWENTASSNIDLSSISGRKKLLSRKSDFDSNISLYKSDKPAKGELNSWRSESKMDSLARRRDVSFQWKRTYDGGTVESKSSSDSKTMLSKGKTQRDRDILKSGMNVTMGNTQAKLPSDANAGNSFMSELNRNVTNKTEQFPGDQQRNRLFESTQNEGISTRVTKSYLNETNTRTHDNQRTALQEIQQAIEPNTYSSTKSQLSHEQMKSDSCDKKYRDFIHPKINVHSAWRSESNVNHEASQGSTLGAPSNTKSEPKSRSQIDLSRIDAQSSRNAKLATGDNSYWRSELNVDNLAKRKDLSYVWKRSYDGRTDSENITSFHSESAQKNLRNRDAPAVRSGLNDEGDTANRRRRLGVVAPTPWRSELNVESISKQRERAEEWKNSVHDQNNVNITSNESSEVLLRSRNGQSTGSSQVLSKPRRPHSVSFDLSGLDTIHTIESDSGATKSPVDSNDKTSGKQIRRWEETASSNIDLSPRLTESNTNKSSYAFEKSTKDSCTPLSNRVPSDGDNSFWRSETNISNLSKSRDVLYEWKRSSLLGETSSMHEQSSNRSDLSRPLGATRIGGKNISASVGDLSVGGQKSVYKDIDDEGLAQLRKTLMETRRNFIMKSRESLRLSRSRHDLSRSMIDERPEFSFNMNESANENTASKDVRKSLNDLSSRQISNSSTIKPTVAISSTSTRGGNYKSTTSVADTTSMQNTRYDSRTTLRATTAIDRVDSRSSKPIVIIEATTPVGFTKSKSSSPEWIENDSDGLTCQIGYFKRPIRMLKLEQSLSDRLGSCLSFSTPNSFATSREFAYEEYDEGSRIDRITVNIEAQTSLKAAGGVKATIVDFDRQCRHFSIGESYRRYRSVSEEIGFSRPNPLPRYCRNVCRRSMRTRMVGFCQECLVTILRSIKLNLIRLLINSTSSSSPHQVLPSITSVVEEFGKLERDLFRRPLSDDRDCHDLGNLLELLSRMHDTFHNCWDVKDNIRSVENILPSLRRKIKDFHHSPLPTAYTVAVNTLSELRQSWQVLARKWSAFDETAERLRRMLKEVEQSLDGTEKSQWWNFFGSRRRGDIDWRQIDNMFASLEPTYQELWQLGADRVMIRDQYRFCEMAIHQLKERDMTSRQSSKTQNQTALKPTNQQQQPGIFTTSEDTHRSVVQKSSQSNMSNGTSGQSQKPIVGTGQVNPVRDTSQYQSTSTSQSYSNARARQLNSSSHQNQERLIETRRDAPSAAVPRQNQSVTRIDRYRDESDDEYEQNIAGVYNRRQITRFQTRPPRPATNEQDWQSGSPAITQSGSLAPDGSFLPRSFDSGWPLAFFLLLLLFLLIYVYPPAVCCRR